jgi:hypothetical protein
MGEPAEDCPRIVPGISQGTAAPWRSRRRSAILARPQAVPVANQDHGGVAVTVMAAAASRNGLAVALHDFFPHCSCDSRIAFAWCTKRELSSSFEHLETDGELRNVVFVVRSIGLSGHVSKQLLK